MGLRRFAFFAAVVLILAASIAMIALGGEQKVATTMGSYGGSGQQPAVADTDVADDVATGSAAVIDPAKQEPVLDLFTSKDPFAPFGSYEPEPEPLPTPTPTSTLPTPTSADVTVSGSTATVQAGDDTPTDDPVLYVADITGEAVTFELLDGSTFDDGSTSVDVAEGQTVMVTAADTGESYRITVDSLNYGSGEPTPAPSKQGHTIKLLSINTQNGVHTATLKVDGTTYADKKVGQTFDTDWGQIEILAIDAGAQTATILHGDDTLVLHVGQTLDK